jgi:hypothetical protein
LRIICREAKARLEELNHMLILGLPTIKAYLSLCAAVREPLHLQHSTV